MNIFLDLSFSGSSGLKFGVWNKIFRKAEEEQSVIVHVALCKSQYAVIMAALIGLQMWITSTIKLDSFFLFFHRIVQWQHVLVGLCNVQSVRRKVHSSGNILAVLHVLFVVIGSAY